MTKQERPLLFGVFVLSCSSLAVLLTSLSTPNWIVSNPKYLSNSTLGTVLRSQLNYGLFQGSYNQPLINYQILTLTTTCLFNDNICAMSCCLTSEQRKQDIEKLYNKQEPDIACCLFTSFNDRTENHNSFYYKFDNTINDNKWIFINAGLWMTTIIFIAIALILNIICCVIAIWNIIGNPIEIWSTVFMLYVWNGVTAFVDVMVMLIWGINFSVYISKNVGIRDTLIGKWDSNGYTSLGFSYWLILLSIIIHGINIVLLYYRQYKISQEQSINKTVQHDQADGAIFLY